MVKPKKGENKMQYLCAIVVGLVCLALALGLVVPLLTSGGTHLPNGDKVIRVGDSQSCIVIHAVTNEIEFQLICKAVTYR